MNRIAMIAAFALVAAAGTFATTAFACPCGGGDTASIPDMTPEAVQAAIAANEVTPVDANGAGARSEHGALPGAIMLTSYEFDIAELPSDTSTALVFYCYNEACSAAPSAAQRAIDAGYTSVAVMPAGITGWIAAGYAVQPSSK